MRNRILLVLENFPYEKGEDTFIIPELEELNKKFEITIVSLAGKKETREKPLVLEKGIKLLHYRSRSLSPVRAIGFLFPFLFYKGTWTELKNIFKDRKCIVPRIRKSLCFFAEAYRFKKWLAGRDVLKENVIYYSYWYSDKVLSAVLLKKSYPGIKIVTRAHGYDLYNERVEETRRQPFKEVMDREVEKVGFVSRQGYEYYLKHFAGKDKDSRKYVINRLGILTKVFLDSRRKTPFLLVSCSNVIRLKRVDMIARALKQIEDCDIRWIHFGTGPEMDHLKKEAESLLQDKKNISYELKGFVDNEQIMRFYEKEKPDCFITTSSTEGSPVSIQEALAYGIPVIGTDVGGVFELIDENGILLPADPTEKQTADAIRRICRMDENEYDHMKKRSYEIWQEEYDRIKNTRKWIQILDSI